MENRSDFETGFKKDGYCPKGKPRALRFPTEIEEQLAQLDDWNEFVVNAVNAKLSSQMSWESDGDNGIAREMFNRLRLVLPEAVEKLPHDERLSLQAQELAIEMILSNRPWFLVQGSTTFRLQWVEDDWLIDGEGAIAWSDLRQAQGFCENMMHVWEQVMLSFEFAARIE